MDFRIDAATEARLARLRALGRTDLRPLGLEADRLGRPVPPEHPFYAKLVALGLGRTRWSGNFEPAATAGDPEPAATAGDPEPAATAGDPEPASTAGDREPAATRGAPAREGSARAALCLAEEMAYWDRGVAVSFPGPGLGEPPVLSMGTAEQKERFLGRFRSPDRPRWASFAMTEPGAGSDVAAIRTSAHRDGGDWILDGEKSFAANASRADWIVVWATVDPALGRAGHRAFVVERGTPGLGDWKIERKMGLKAYESTSFTLRGCRVPAANLLGGEEHYARRAGFKGAMQSFNATRPAIAAMAVGIGRAALDEALRTAREGGRLGDARVRDRLERAHRKLRAARLLCWRAAWLADHGRPNIVEASLCKAVAPAVALEVTAAGVEIAGEAAGRGDGLAEKLFRDVKAMDIVEGTGQIQRLLIARQLLGYPRDPDAGPARGGGAPPGADPRTP